MTQTHVRTVLLIKHVFKRQKILTPNSAVPASIINEFKRPQIYAHKTDDGSLRPQLTDITNFKWPTYIITRYVGAL